MSPDAFGAFCYFRKKAIKKYTLHKGERLKKRKVIEHLFKGGTSFNVYPFRIYYHLNKDVNAANELTDKGEGTKEPLLQFGVGVSKKYFKKAVDRNRIKRLTREVYRLQKLPLQEILVAKKKIHLQVFFIFTGKEMPNFEIVKQKVYTALQRLEQQVNSIEC